MSQEGKVIALTGGGSGIGLATARLLASRGALLSIADTNSTNLVEVEVDFKKNGWPLLAKKVDVRSAGQVTEWIEETVKKFGRLDGAANIAGIVGKQWGKASMAELDVDDFKLVIDVNVIGVMNSLRAELRHIVDNGSIVNISSAQGSRGAAGCAAYVTSKHAVMGLTKCAARDFGHRGIRVNTVAPGSIITPLLTSVVGEDESAWPTPTSSLPRFGKPEEVALQIAWLLGPESSFSTGELFRCDGGEFA